MKPEIVNLGSLYFNATPVIPGAMYQPNLSLAIGNTVPRHKIQWLKDGDRLIAIGNVCNDISWERLDRLGFVFGTPIRIDARLYLCRSLKVGSKKDEGSEWDNLVARYGEDNTLWHWKEVFFWGQDSVQGDDHLRAVRGCYSAKYFGHYYATTHGTGLGFRPVLEPLPCPSTLLNALLGKTISAYGPQGHIIKGALAEFDEYDIVLTSAALVPEKCTWAHREGQKIVISSGQVLWREENVAENC